MDNMLRVERDVKQHAEEQSAKQRAEQEAAFGAKLDKLRRRARGNFDEPEEPAASRGGDSACLAGASTAGNSRQQTGRTSSDEYKGSYGVTLSNLKEAERHLDATLKGKGKGQRPETYWGAGDLGSGPHINFFEDAEREHERHLEEHGKQLRYTQTNNELAGKPKNALFSDFDEITNDVPWYMRPQRNGTRSAPGEESCAEAPAGDAARSSAGNAASVTDASRALRGASRSRSRSPSARQVSRTTRHGQTVLRLRALRHGGETQGQEQEQAPMLVSDVDDEVSAVDSKVSPRPYSGSGLSARVIGATDADRDRKGQKVKKEKKKKKEKTTNKRGSTTKKEKKERRGDDTSHEREELKVLRVQRAQREEAERKRAARLVGGGIMAP